MLVNFKNVFLSGFVILMSGIAHADLIKIPLTEVDQRALTNSLAKINSNFKSEQVIQETPIRIVLKKYNFLDESHAFYIHCSEEFVVFENFGKNQQCEVGFNYEQSISEVVESHDGFIPEFSVVKIKDSALANVLYSAIAKGTNSPSVFFNTREQFSFTHPQTGAKFSAFRLRVDCTRDAAFKNYGCTASAVK